MWLSYRNVMWGVVRGANIQGSIGQVWGVNVGRFYNRWAHSYLIIRGKGKFYRITTNPVFLESVGLALGENPEGTRGENRRGILSGEVATIVKWHP